jgi:dTDP-4-dehydrorhamnose reductase
MDGTLILGGTGFLGPHAAALALARSRAAAATFARPLGPPVWAVGRSPEDAPRFGTPRDGVQWVTRDLEPEGAVTALLEELRPKRVLSCAALARVAACEAEPERALRLNAGVPAEAARWCGQRGARLVHVSTDLVFGATLPRSRAGFREEDPPAPVSVYGDTKARGEAAVLEACPAALVARLPLLIGDSGGRGLGASDSLLVAVERDETPPLFVDEWRSPLEVTQAARALVELLGRSDTGLLHLAGPERVNRFELGCIVLEEYGLGPVEARACLREARQAEVETGGPRPPDTTLDAGRARRRLKSLLEGPRVALRRALGGNAAPEA